jgi:hypothetical protein
MEYVRCQKFIQINPIFYLVIKDTVHTVIEVTVLFNQVFSLKCAKFPTERSDWHRNCTINFYE